MSDSESDTSNAFINFQNDITTVNAKGPNTNFSFRYPMTSMYNNMSQKFEKQRYAESAYSQRSMYYGRETSPMSIQSACDRRPLNYQQYVGMGSRSVFNGRGGSPMSMRSIDSSVSVSAADIAFAFKNAKFNKTDLKMIRDAYQKLIKQRGRRRIEKRRKRLLLKSRRPGGDSGDQASDSSVSSDDYRSVKTYKENMSSSRSARMNLTDFRKTIRDHNMFKDTENISQNPIKNKFPAWSTSKNTQNLNNTATSSQFNSMPTQKDRFRNGFLLPSQRFNRSVASSAIIEHSEKPTKNTGSNPVQNVKNHYAQNKNNRHQCPSGSEEEEIFSEMTARETSTFNMNAQQKRTLDSEDESSLPVSKKSRVTSPARSAVYNKKSPLKMKNIKNNVELSNSFEFAKPSLPVRKSKSKVQEKVIAKSAQPLTEFLEPVPNNTKDNVQVLQPYNLQEKSNDNITQLDQSELTQTSDLSSRPSFIKRKLFTQKLDVTEKANISTDGTNSPHSSVYILQKEKSKARKLVTNQSCLNREVGDDNNLLDLIHKIVPLDRMNVTNQANLNNENVKNKKDKTSKWDVTSVISMCNEDDVSDTYTDEEIFEADSTVKSKNKDVNTKAKPIDQVVTKTLITQNRKVILNKLESNALQKHVVNQNFNLTHNNVTKNNAKCKGKSFWDTDFESDAECQTVLPRSTAMDNSMKANATLDTTKQNFKNPLGYARNEIPKNNTELPKQLNNTWMNKTVNTFNNIQKPITSTLTVRSHRNSKKKKCGNETTVNESISKVDNLGDKKKNRPEQPLNQPANKVEKVNSNTDLQSKNSTDMPKNKTKTQNEKKNANAKSVTQNLKSPKEKQSATAKSSTQNLKSPKENKTMKEKRAVSPKTDIKKSESKSKSVKTSKAKNKEKNTETQKNITKIKNKPEKQNEREISPKTKPKSKSVNQSTKKKNPGSQTTNLNTNNTARNTSYSGRPLRSCRTPSQNRSELSGSQSQLNTSFDISKSLRSRVINLSSSIENITIKITSKNKNNKNISEMIPRKSDVSFSLGSQTPLSKRMSARRRANFSKGRR